MAWAGIMFAHGLAGNNSVALHCNDAPLPPVLSLSLSPKLLLAALTSPLLSLGLGLGLGYDDDDPSSRTQHRGP